MLECLVLAVLGGMSCRSTVVESSYQKIWPLSCVVLRSMTLLG